MSEEKLSNIAILIDADNTPISIIAEILATAESFGQIGIKKIYGDWGSSYLKKWQSVILEYAITPVHQFAYTKGKNATDISMVIDAMDLLAENLYDGFCLVSSDSDFAPLAARLRAGKVKVFGFGRSNTPDSFRKACDEFVCLQVPTETEKTDASLPHIPDHIKEATLKIINDKQEPNGWTKLEVVAANLRYEDNSFSAKKYGFPQFLSFIQNIPEVALKKNRTNYFCRQKTEQELNDPEYQHAVTEKESSISPEIKHLVFEAITYYDDGEHDGWVKMSDVGYFIRNKIENFSFKQYGFKRLSDFLKSIPEVDIKITDHYSICRWKKEKLKLNASQITQEIMVLLKNSTHKKGWLALSAIENHFQNIDPKITREKFIFVLEQPNIQCLEIPKYNEPREKYYRKIPFLELVEQLKKLSRRTDIPLRDAKGNIQVHVLEKYAPFHVPYGKYGFQSFSQFFSEVVEYHKKQQVKTNAASS